MTLKQTLSRFFLGTKWETRDEHFQCIACGKEFKLTRSYSPNDPAATNFNTITFAATPKMCPYCASNLVKWL